MDQIEKDVLYDFKLINDDLEESKRSLEKYIAVKYNI